MNAAFRILFVEDSRDDVELILFELRRGGLTPDYWVVDTAEGLRAALRDGRWDLIIADHSMPRFDAPAALDILKASGQDLPFIVVSGHIGEEMAVACMKAGASDYLAKDQLARLVPAVERELREAGERRQRREAVEALRASEARYRLLVENMADILSVFDEGGRYTFLSPSVTRVLGWAPEEALGHSVLEFAHPDDAERVEAAIAEAARGGRPFLTGVRFRHQDGSWRILEASGARLVGDDDTVSVVSLARDITDRVQLEGQLHQAQKMEAVGRLAGGVAHDFNNLLTVILGYSNLLLDQLADNRLLYQEVDEIKRAADRAAALTQKLLSVSRKQVLSLQPVDLNPVAEGVSDMLRRLIGEDIELVMKLAPGLGLTRVDPGLIEQVVMNLAVNARDAMPQGGRLVLQTADVELDEAYGRRHGVQPGRYVMLSVTDTGQGMDAATQARLFEPFFTTKEPGKGTGLGLSTVYGIVRQAGGNVFVYSELGHGSCFKVYLPRVPEEGEAPPRPRADTAGSETVLLVEDEPLVRNLVSEVLRKSGYEVLEFGNGREAIARARHHAGPIQLLVTDVVMPGMSGIELSRQLAEAQEGLRILFLSGYSDDLVVRQGALLPGRAFLQKPFTPDSLLRAVRALLDAPAPGPTTGTAAIRAHPAP